MKSITTLTVGTLGLTSSLAMASIDIKPILDVIVQIAIGVATLVSLLKRKPKNQ